MRMFDITIKRKTKFFQNKSFNSYQLYKNQRNMNYYHYSCEKIFNNNHFSKQYVLILHMKNFDSNLNYFVPNKFDEIQQ